MATNTTATKPAEPRDPQDEVQIFRLRTALLKEGRSHVVLADTPPNDGSPLGMNIAIKCYAEGGENVFHTHAHDNHSFVVLQGRARFHQPDRDTVELGRNEGILLPAGAFYRFESCGDEPLVLYRVASTAYRDGRRASLETRLGPDGKAIHARSKENRHAEPVVIEGAFYE